MRHAKLITVVLTLLMWAVAAPAADDYEIGGPLAGVKLPLFRTRHGEPPGYPGSLPDKMAAAEEVKDGQLTYRAWGPQAQAPQLELYPGSAENYRAYMFKYMPIRSFFDRQSQLKNFVAPAIAGAAKKHIEHYAAPLYWVPRHRPPTKTDKRLEPVPVVRCRIDDPILKLDLGTLPVGLYAVRVIAAVEPKQLRPYRRPVYLRMKVNDGIKREASEYRIRIGYCDEFYSVAEIYFHAPQERAYRAELHVDKGSQADLLVHNVSLDDVLAGATRRPIKTKGVFEGSRPTPGAPTPPRHQAYARQMRQPLGKDERLARDRAIWQAFPPVNAQAATSALRGSWLGRPRDPAIDEAMGEWDHVSPQHVYGAFLRDPANYGVLLVNRKLDLKYTMNDLRHNRPLPDPFPLKDDGAGVFFLDPEDPNGGAAFCPIAGAVGWRVRNCLGAAAAGAAMYQVTGRKDYARDGALALVRFAHNYPTIDIANYFFSLVREAGPYGRDYRCRRRETTALFYSHYANYLPPIYAYDKLFDYISTSQGLADSVHRFIPWVNKPEDLVELIDVYLVQTLAKRILRYHYHTDPLAISKCATVLGDRSVTEDWMEWLFTRTFIYPLPPTGIQDAMITGCERDGCEYVASTYYAQGEGASRIASGLTDYIQRGGNPKYDLSDPRRYPKARAHGLWHEKIVVAGCDFLRIGDVTGPDKRPGQFGRKGPQLASRVMPYWAGVLEAGRRHRNVDHKRAAYLRMGFGFGHHHRDTLDLQLVAYGQPMTIDGGQRGGYSSPGDRATRVHNLVQVDGAPNWGHSWVTALSDIPGAHYMQAEMVPPGGARLYRRQVALIDTEKPDGPARPEGYVFDVVRVSGGKEHAYCFHGLVDDGFEWNVRGETSAANDPYLRPFGRSRVKKSGAAPEVFEATWRQIREKKGRGFGSEQSWGKARGPRKFTRLHLFDVAGARAYRAEAVCHKWGYQFTCTMVRRQGADLESAFPAIIEPFLGTPFITATRQLAIADNDTDALKAVALEVKTVHGNTDICLAGGRPEKLRRAGPLKAAGEFAYYSTDRDGFRQCALTGGTVLEGPHVRLAVKVPERTGKVVRVDYLKKTLWLDTPWPAWKGERVFEIGVPGRRTTYTAAQTAPQGAGTRVTVPQGADFFRSRVTKVDPAKSTVKCALGIALGLKPGIDRQWVASNDAMTTFWRADYLDNATFKLTGPPVSQAAFGKAQALRLWEYGVGDMVRQSTFVSVRRLEPAVYGVQADVDLELTLSGKTHKITVADLARNGGTVRVHVEQ